VNYKFLIALIFRLAALGIERLV